MPFYRRRVLLLLSGEEAVNHLLAIFFCEGIEEGGVTGYTNHQIGVQIGILICGHQLIGIQNIDIDQGSALAEMLPNQSTHSIYASFIRTESLESELTAPYLNLLWEKE